MKKAFFYFSIFFIIIATFALGFFFWQKPKIKPIEAQVSVKESEEKNVSQSHFPVSENKIKILFVGDMMFDRWIRQSIEKKGVDYIFSGVDGILKDSDLVVGNLEGPITSSDSVSVGSEIGSRENYVFTFPKETAQNISNKNIKLVNLGNNHILNFKEDGANEARKYLAEANVKYFGNVGEKERRFFIADFKGFKVGFVNFNQFMGDGKQAALDDLREVRRKSDFVIVYTHWGKEFKTQSDEKERQLAHEFVDAGADLVIGTHPHVIQESEEYKGKKIYYSLGNFLFDQYFSPETKKGLAVQLELNGKNKPIFKEHYVEMKKDGRTILPGK